MDDPQEVARLDEQFHEQLVDAAGNPELTRIYEDVVERIRIIRRLDFTRAQRIGYTYDEHAQDLAQLVATQCGSRLAIAARPYRNQQDGSSKDHAT